eukprot:13407669-Heterocapsa_arctica.AAC.1
METSTSPQQFIDVKNTSAATSNTRDANHMLNIRLTYVEEGGRTVEMSNTWQSHVKSRLAATHTSYGTYVANLLAQESAQ